MQKKGTSLQLVMDSNSLLQKRRRRSLDWVNFCKDFWNCYQGQGKKFANRPIQLTQCRDQFKPFGNKKFSFRNFIIISSSIIIIITSISLFFTANFKGYSRLLSEETLRNHQAYKERPPISVSFKCECHIIMQIQHTKNFNPGRFELCTTLSQPNELFCVFTDLANIYANLLEQKKAFT